jgi:trehalose 6-phosphate phosphatase
MTITKLQQIIKNFSLKSQIFLDYDGTLVPIVMDPENCYAPESLRQLLKELDTKYELYIVSGRTIEDLRKFIGLDLNYIYLHGLMADLKGKKIEFVENTHEYINIFEKLNSENPFSPNIGVRMYSKPFGVVYHLGLVKAENLSYVKEIILRTCKEYNLEPYFGKNLIELKIPGVNKGSAIKSCRNQKQCLIAGDEETDEYAFNACSECITIHIGNSTTAAKFTVDNLDDFREILFTLAQRPLTS